MARYLIANSEHPSWKKVKRLWKGFSEYCIPLLPVHWQFWIRWGELSFGFGRLLRNIGNIIGRLRRHRLTYDDLDRMLIRLQTHFERMKGITWDRLGPGWRLASLAGGSASAFLRTLLQSSWVVERMRRGWLTDNDEDRMVDLLQENVKRMITLAQDHHPSRKHSSNPSSRSLLY